jgi:hypothetical protein
MWEEVRAMWLWCEGLCHIGYVCMYVCMYVSMYVCMSCVYVCMYVCHVCMYVCMYVMCVCMYVCHVCVCHVYVALKTTHLHSVVSPPANLLLYHSITHVIHTHK